MKQSLLYTVIMLTALQLSNTAGAFAQKKEKTPRFEIGGQFSTLLRTEPRPVFSDTGGATDDSGRDNRYGFGARFTYNVTDNIALEAEGNFFPNRDASRSGSIFLLSAPSGNIYQGQFGVKVGKRFSKVGVFGKVRPGLVRFSEISKLVDTTTVTFNNQQFTQGIFRVGKENYFSTDVGGVVEFYHSRRIMTRVDVGDTIVRYGTYRVQSFAVSRPFVERPPETRHSLQLSVGVGFRF